MKAKPLQINQIYKSAKDMRNKVIEVLRDIGMIPATDYINVFPNELRKPKTASRCCCGSSTGS